MDQLVLAQGKDKTLLSIWGTSHTRAINLIAARQFDQAANNNLCKRRNIMWTIIIILVVLWLLGVFGGRLSPNFPKTGNWIHVLIVIAVILFILSQLGMI
jgi:protein-S-isoprenylcysteine O-methyltransferase Ste14